MTRGVEVDKTVEAELKELRKVKKAYDQRRPVSGRELADTALVEEIKTIPEASDQTYGSPRVHAQLERSGEGMRRRRVERLMREHGVRSGTTRLYRRMPGAAEFFASPASGHFS